MNFEVGVKVEKKFFSKGNFDNYLKTYNYKSQLKVHVSV